MRPPCRFDTKRRSASRKKKQSIALDEYSRLVVHFSSRSTFDVVVTGQRSIFGEIDVFQLYKTIATELWQIAIAMKPLPPCWWTINIIVIYNLLLLYGSCRCIIPGRPPGHVRRAASVPAVRPLATFGVRCWLHCRRTESAVSQMNSRYEFRSSRNPYRDKEHMNFYHTFNLGHWPDLGLDFGLILWWCHTSYSDLK